MGPILLGFKTVNAKIHKKSIYLYELLALANKICLVSINSRHKELFGCK